MKLPTKPPPELFESHSRVRHCVPSEQCVGGLRTRWSTRSESEGEAYSLLHVDVQHIEQSEEMFGGQQRSIVLVPVDVQNPLDLPVGEIHHFLDTSHHLLQTVLDVVHVLHASQHALGLRGRCSHPPGERRDSDASCLSTDRRRPPRRRAAVWREPCVGTIPPPPRCRCAPVRTSCSSLAPTTYFNSRSRQPVNTLLHVCRRFWTRNNSGT